jgi:hypothetical protein
VTAKCRMLSSMPHFERVVRTCFENLSIVSFARPTSLSRFRETNLTNLSSTTKVLSVWPLDAPPRVPLHMTRLMRIVSYRSQRIGLLTRRSIGDPMLRSWTPLDFRAPMAHRSNTNRRNSHLKMNVPSPQCDTSPPQ